MLYSISIVIIVHHFLVWFSSANQSVEDKMLIAFVGNDQKMQISEYSKQKYEAYLGIVYFMRIVWQCDEIQDEFEEYERTECQKYRKYLDILYEYLYRESAGIPTVKPKFLFKQQIEIEGPIIYAVNCLVHISQFYFKSKQSKNYKLNKLFENYYFKPKLLNEERLNYETKLSINEMILQLAIDTANEWQTIESLNGIIQLNCGQKFKKNLKEMFKKSKKKAKNDHGNWGAYTINDDKHLIIINSKFDDNKKWTEDALFSEFVINSEKFFTMTKEYSDYLQRLKKKGQIYFYDLNEQTISLELNEIEKMEKYFTQKFEVYLGSVYLMRENWHCEKIGDKFEENERTKCKKYRKYLDILYEYFFRLYAVEAKLPPLVKPIFIIHKTPYMLIDVVRIFNETSKEFWQKGENEFVNKNISEINLENENELNYEMKEEKSGENVSKNKMEAKITKLRKEFEQKMEKMYENTKKSAKEENAKAEKAIEIIVKNKKMINEYNRKFDTFVSSPFSSPSISKKS